MRKNKKKYQSGAKKNQLPAKVLENSCSGKLERINSKAMPKSLF